MRNDNPRTTHPVAYALLSTLLMTAPAAAAPADDDSGAALRGTFLQFSERYDGWRRADWEGLFDDFARLGLEQVVVQWSLLDARAFYPSEHFAAAEEPPLGTILSLADEAGMEVFVGLAHDSDYWSRIDRDPDLVEVYLTRLRLASLAAARELEPLVKRHESFRGWYLPEEIDDVHWLGDESRSVLVRHLRLSAEALRELVPDARVAVSGFTNAHADPATLEAFWWELLTESSVDRVLFQDGIGVGKLDPDELPLYLGAMRRAVERAGAQLEVVVEVFAQTAGPPIDAGPFRAVPAPADRVRRQIEIAAAFSTGGPVAFAVPEYMTSLGGAEAQALRRALAGGEGRSE